MPIFNLDTLPIKTYFETQNVVWWDDFLEIDMDWSHWGDANYGWSEDTNAGTMTWTGQSSGGHEVVHTYTYSSNSSTTTCSALNYTVTETEADYYDNNDYSNANKAYQETEISGSLNGVAFTHNAIEDRSDFEIFEFTHPDYGTVTTSGNWPDDDLGLGWDMINHSSLGDFLLISNMSGSVVVIGDFVLGDGSTITNATLNLNHETDAYHLTGTHNGVAITESSGDQSQIDFTLTASSVDTTIPEIGATYNLHEM